MSLQEYKAELLSVLSDAYDETGWSDAALEEALREALDYFQIYGEIREATFALVDSGYEHDLSTLGANEVLSIGWPWGDGYRLESVARDWREIGNDMIRMDDLSLDAGENVRVRYVPLHTIEHLDGAGATTLSASERRRFMLAAAAEALSIRARYLLYQEKNAELSKSMEGASELLMGRFHEMDGGSGGGPIYWGRLA